MKTSIDIVITTCNNYEGLSKILASLQEQTYQKYKCFVIDDDPTEVVQKLVTKNFPWVKYLSVVAKNGPARNRNIAIDEGNSEYIVVLDDDVILIETWLESMFSFIKSNVNIGCVGSQLRFQQKPDTINSIGIYLSDNGIGGDIFFNRKLSAIDEYVLNVPIKMAAVCSAATIFRRDVFELAGRFDPKYFYLGEDTDLCYRIYLCGYDIFYNPSAVAYHKMHGVSNRFKYKKIQYLCIRNSVYTILKNLSFKTSFKSIVLCIYDYKRLPIILGRALVWNIINIISVMVWKNKIKKVKKKNSVDIIKLNKQLIDLIEMQTKERVNCHSKKRDLYIETIGKIAGNRSKNILHEQKIKNLIFHTTNLCNQNCKHCFMHDRLNNKKDMILKLPEIEQFFSKLGRLNNVVLGGGEPFLRKDLVEICQIIDKYNDASITIPTNSFNPGKIANIVECILKSTDCSLTISLSLDGLSEIHDEIRGVHGVFDKVHETYIELAKLKMRYWNKLWLQVNSSIFNVNYNNFEAIYNYVHDKMKFAAFSFETIRGNFDHSQVKSISNEDYSKLIHLLESKYNYSKEKIYLHKLSLEILNSRKQIVDCKAGKSFIVLDCEGNLGCCEILEPIANIRDFEYDYRKIMQLREWHDCLNGICDHKCWCTHMCFLAGSL